MLESDHALAPIAHALDTRRWQNVDIERVQIDHNDCEQLPFVEGLRNLDTNREYIRNAACSTPVSYDVNAVQYKTSYTCLYDGSMGLKSGE